MLTPTTLAVVAIGALVIFGPKKLPELARALGKSLSEFKAATEEARTAIQQEIKEPAAPSASESGQKPEQPSA